MLATRLFALNDIRTVEVPIPKPAPGEVLVRVLREANFNRTLAATRLGLNLRQIRYRIQRLQIPMPKDAIDHEE